MQLLPSTGDRNWESEASMKHAAAWRRPRLTTSREEFVTHGNMHSTSRKLSQAEGLASPPSTPASHFSVAFFPLGSAQFQPGHTGAVNSVAFSPVDSSLLASGSDDNTIRLWDLLTMRQQAILQGHSASVLSVAFNRLDTGIQNRG